MDAIDNIGPLQSRQTLIETLQTPRTRFSEKVTSFADKLSQAGAIQSDETISDTEKSDAMKKLQAMFISEMIGELFKEQTESTFGQGTQGNFYASVFTDAIAEKLAERDLLHFDKLLSPK